MKKIKKINRRSELPFNFTGISQHCDEGGVLEWFVLGKRHRTDGPAIILPNGRGERWYQNDVLHREDGPATIGRSEHTTYLNWFIQGMELTEKQFKAFLLFSKENKKILLKNNAEGLCKLFEVIPF